MSVVVANSVQTFGTDKVLVIGSMHRSGSSLVASVLQESGLHIGEELLPAADDNSLGFFENVDFYQFHKELLTELGRSPEGYVGDNNWRVPSHSKKKAQTLIAKSRIAGMWGWKDPRTCLFLDFWEEIIPHANFLFVFRSPWQVVDSLLRRGHQDFDQRPELAFEVWFCYNSMIVDFIARNPQKCFLIDLSQVIESESYISSLNERFGLNLKPSSKKLFQDKLLKARMPSFYEAITLEHFPECFELHQRMLALASIKPNLSEPDRTLSKREAMQEWLKFRTIEKEKHEAEKLRNHYAEHLQVQREKCNALETHVSNLEKAREQLLQEKEFINHHLSALQKSRTWKLRSAIVKLKSFGRSLQSE